MFESAKNIFHSFSKEKPPKKVEVISSVTRKPDDVPAYKKHASYDTQLDKEGVGIKWGETDNSASGTRDAYEKILDEQIKKDDFKNRTDAIPFKKADPNFIEISGDIKTYEIPLDNELDIEDELKDTRDKIDKIRPAA